MEALKNKHFTTADKLCDFVNENNIQVVSICTTSFACTLFYKDKL